ncbi:MAG: DUF4145 domain-containing protein [Lacticaseibacillus paracasei]|uniref:DUF4145 domain-containing protein n=1 Tax=Lacticaseibacillus paracasei TaxID=1597 RepID=UPI00345D5615
MKIGNDYRFWNYTKDINGGPYTCGYCGNTVTSTIGMELNHRSVSAPYPVNDKPYGVFICPTCKLPTAIFPNDREEVIQIPGAEFGAKVEHVPQTVNDIYNEARSAYSAGAFTGVILLCRVLLSHVAVEFGAKPGDSFQNHINYLKDNGYLTVNSSTWVDKIRKYGNDANHKLTVNTREDAEKIIKFSEMVLKMNYEYPEIANSGSEAQKLEASKKPSPSSAPSGNPSVNI